MLGSRSSFFNEKYNERSRDKTECEDNANGDDHIRRCLLKSSGINVIQIQIEWIIHHVNTKIFGIPVGQGGAEQRVRENIVISNRGVVPNIVEPYF